MLVTLARYRTVTGDTTSPDVRVTGALVDAQELLEAELDRPLEAGERTETLRFDRRGSVWPSATPVTAVPATHTIVGGREVVGVTPDVGPSGWFYTRADFDSVRPEATLTYTGGFTAATLPEPLAREICWRAYDLLRPNELPNVAALVSAASSVQLGDASISFANSTGGAGGGTVGGLPRPSPAQVRAYRKPRVP